jgi:hypothetical protein
LQSPQEFFQQCSVFNQQPSTPAWGSGEQTTQEIHGSQAAFLRLVVELRYDVRQDREENLWDGFINVENESVRIFTEL